MKAKKIAASIALSTLLIGGLLSGTPAVKSNTNVSYAQTAPELDQASKKIMKEAKELGIYDENKSFQEISSDIALYYQAIQLGLEVEGKTFEQIYDETWTLAEEMQREEAEVLGIYTTGKSYEDLSIIIEAEYNKRELELAQVFGIDTSDPSLAIIKVQNQLQAIGLGIDVKGKSYEELEKEVSTTLEKKSIEHAEQLGIDTKSLSWQDINKKITLQDPEFVKTMTIAWLEMVKQSDVIKEALSLGIEMTGKSIDEISEAITIYYQAIGLGVDVDGKSIDQITEEAWKLAEEGTIKEAKELGINTKGKSYDELWVLIDKAYDEKALEIANELGVDTSKEYGIVSDVHTILQAQSLDLQTKGKTMEELSELVQSEFVNRSFIRAIELGINVENMSWQEVNKKIILQDPTFVNDMTGEYIELLKNFE
ncbi:hypothetical protein [Chengkuizengella axinellae]|uniref:Uncharacterized protein n=1 Tax=Chengkuizengella axinellae TaxID=3064388 RepID=A0ABT9J317_9BACL|nr:hypothetical protein [Chengkuizengella sp. 2205SS18-9]MDP5276004.1 hypothetical protein [Chengkuizengella sp. 2205SS18-9]